MTKNQRSFDSPVMMSSEIPSALLRVAAHIGERQYGDRWPIGTRDLSRGGDCGAFDHNRCGIRDDRDAVDPNRPCNVLDRLLAHVFESKTQLVAHLVEDLSLINIS